MTPQSTPHPAGIVHPTRRRWLAAPALLAVALMACGSPAEDAAPPTTDTTTRPAPTATTADTAQVAGPQAAALQSSTMPDNQLGRQMAWFLEAVRNLPIPAADIQEHFAPALLAMMPADQLNAALAQADDTTAVRFLGVVTATATSIDVAIDPGTGLPHTVIAITVDGDGKIINLQFKPVPLTSRASAGLAPISLTEPTGPFPVGTDTIVATDAARDDRRIPAQLWYPADPDADDQATPAPYASPATAAFLAARLAIPVEDVAAIGTNATLASPVAGEGPLPVVLFSPGYAETRPRYSGLAAQLASHGYLVAVLDHPGDGDLVEFTDGTTVTAAPPPTAGDFDPEALVATRLADAQTVVELLEQLDAAPRGPFTDALDLSQIAFAGHSLGGATAAEAMRLDDRFQVGANLDGTMVGDVVETGLDRPFLLIGTNDHEEAEDETWTTFRANTPTALQLGIDGAAHMTFSDWPTLATLRPANERDAFGIGTIDPQRSAVVQTAYLLAFLDHHLRHQQQPLLDGPSPDYPEVRFR